MCGRYTLTADPTELAAYFDLDTVPTLEPRFNIAPTQSVPVIRAVPELGRHLDLVRWGLIPVWAKDRAIGNRMINARADTVAVKPAFRAALRHRRCLVVADGFYEWRQVDGHKQPYWIGFEGRTPFAFAGLWEHWQDRSSGERVESCAIITTDANPLVRTVHDRMPVILPPQHFDAWLDPQQTAAEPLLALLKPHADTDMIAYPVSRNVNNPRNDEAELLAPVEPD